MFSRFVVKFQAFAAATGSTIGTVVATVFAGACMLVAAGRMYDHWGPGDFRSTAVTKNDTFNPGHDYLLDSLVRILLICK
jgi:hypothetical protein